MPTSKRLRSVSRRSSASSRAARATSIRLRVHVDLPGRRCEPAAPRGLRRSSRARRPARVPAGSRQVGFVGAAPDRIGHADANGPGRVIVARTAGRAPIRSGVTLPGPAMIPGKPPVRRIRFRQGRSPDSWRSLSHRAAAGCSRARCGVGAGDAGARAREIGAVPECAVTAASRSMAIVPTGGVSIGSIFTFHIERSVGSKMRTRSRSSTWRTAVSAMISCSWFAATSACAGRDRAVATARRRPWPC